MNSLAFITPTLGSRRVEEYALILPARVPGWPWCVVCPPHRRVALGEMLGGEAQVIGERSTGMYGAVNCGIAFTTANWITYINDDDALAPGFNLMAHRHCIAENERVVAYGRVAMIDEAGGELYQFPTTGEAADRLELWREGIMPFTQQGMIFSRLVWETLGGFDESYHYSGDLDFWVRAHIAGFTFKFYDLKVAAWRIRPGQLSGHHLAVQLETERALAPILDMNLSWGGRKLAKLRFRWRNSPHYIRRGLKLRRLRQAKVFG
jgi:glycosyltransferase involved in cell wall biosynthesis